MKSTSNLGLKKPDQTDFYNVEDSNNNMDKIDTEITTVKSSIEKVATDLGNIELTAKKVTIEDTEGNFLSPVVEGALQELATKDRALETKINTTKTELDAKIDTTKTTLETTIANDKTEVDKDIADLKQSVSSGKQLIATATTGRGVPTNGGDSFQTMASNIDAIDIKTPIAQDELGVIEWKDGTHEGFKEITLAKKERAPSDRTSIRYFKNALPTTSGFYTNTYAVASNYNLYASGRSRYKNESLLTKTDRDYNVKWQYQFESWVQKIIIHNEQFLYIYHGSTTTEGEFVTKLDVDGNLIWTTQIVEAPLSDIAVDKEGYCYVIRGTLPADGTLKIFKLEPTEGKLIQTKDTGHTGKGNAIGYNAKINRICVVSSGLLIMFDTDLSVLTETSWSETAAGNVTVNNDGTIIVTGSQQLYKLNADLTKDWQYNTLVRVEAAVNDFLESYYIGSTNYITKIDAYGYLIWSNQQSSSRNMQFLKGNLLTFSGANDGNRAMYFYQDNFAVTENIQLSENFISLR